MRAYRRTGAVLIVLAVLVAFGQAGAGATQSRLARAVYVTTTKACACTLKRCQAGDAVVAGVFSGARQRLLSRVDMATSKDAASAYIRNYGVMVLPSLLLLDAQGKLLWSAQGEMNRDEIAKQLSQLGG